MLKPISIQKRNREQRLRKHKIKSNRGILHEWNKETEATKSRIRIFGLKYACTYIGLHMQANYMRTHTSSLHTHAKACERRHTLNPNPATQNCKT